MQFAFELPAVIVPLLDGAAAEPLAEPAGPPAAAGPDEAVAAEEADAVDFDCFAARFFAAAEEASAPGTAAVATDPGTSEAAAEPEASDCGSTADPSAVLLMLLSVLLLGLMFDVATNATGVATAKTPTRISSRPRSERTAHFPLTRDF